MTCNTFYQCTPPSDGTFIEPVDRRGGAVGSRSGLPGRGSGGCVTWRSSRLGALATWASLLR